MRGSKMSNKSPLKYKPSTYRVKPYGRLLKIPNNRQSQRTYNNYYNHTEEYMSHLSNEDNNDNFEGFCIDLLKILSQQVDGFEYRISLVADGKYGIFDGNSWNGIVKSLMEKVDRPRPLFILIYYYFNLKMSSKNSHFLFISLFCL